MTVTHVVFSLACAAYILLAVKYLEEPDLRVTFGEEYTGYTARVPAYCPFTSGCRHRLPAAAATTATPDTQNST